MFGIDIAEKLTGMDKLKLLAAILLVLSILGACFGAGWAVNGWRKDVERAEGLSEKDRQISDLSSKILAQNAAIDTLKIRSDEAALRKKQAAELNKATLDSLAQ